MMRFLLVSFIAIVSGNYLFAQTPDKNIIFRSNINYENLFSPSDNLANIWGHVDSLGNEYALVGWHRGLSIVNVTNPDAPVIVRQIDGVTNLWREVKTYKNYAFVTTEGANAGLQVIDLSHLPDTSLMPVNTIHPTINGQVLNTIHALHVDTAKGVLYLYGSNIGSGGALAFSLTDPFNPAYLGYYNEFYVHDGYADNDTLFASHVYNGFFRIVDMTNKNNPVILAEQTTPNFFTHNTWLTPDKKTLLTTDEVDDSWMGAYDITDLNNITKTDQIQSQNPGSQSIIHNVEIRPDNFAVTAWYKDGVVITDVSRPHNLVNVGWYDTSPLQGGGFDGAWGAYPYLPSGNIVVGDMSGGLFVLTPTYKRACYLEGMVMDSVCNTPLAGAAITATNGIDTLIEITGIDGVFMTGTPDDGLYTITISKQGFNTLTINNALFVNGQVYNLNASMSSVNGFPLDGHVSDSMNVALANVPVFLANSGNSYSFMSDNAGDFSHCDVIEDTYHVVAGKWGYKTICDSVFVNSAQPFDLKLGIGYYDDFTFDYNWTVQSTSPTGNWVRAVPFMTFFGASTMANPGWDASGDCNTMCFVTGNNGVSTNDDDVDNGYTLLASPVFDLSGMADPYISYERWFFNRVNGAPNDTMKIMIDDGVNTVVVETITKNTLPNSAWVAHSFRVKDFVNLTPTMQLKIKVQDYAPDHCVEAGFDKFAVNEYNILKVKNELLSNEIKVYPNPFNELTNIEFKEGLTHVSVLIYDSNGTLVESKYMSNAIGTCQIGKKLTAGIYYVRITSDGNFSKAFKISKVN